MLGVISTIYFLLLERSAILCHGVSLANVCDDVIHIIVGGGDTSDGNAFYEILNLPLGNNGYGYFQRYQATHFYLLIYIRSTSGRRLEKNKNGNGEIYHHTNSLCLAAIAIISYK